MSNVTTIPSKDEFKKTLSLGDAFIVDLGDLINKINPKIINETDTIKTRHLVGLLGKLTASIINHDPDDEKDENGIGKVDFMGMIAHFKTLTKQREEFNATKQLS